MLWLALAALVVAVGLAAHRAGSPGARAGFWFAIAALASVVLALRFGVRLLPLVAPTLAWLAWRWRRTRTATPGAGSFEPPPRRRAMTREEALRVLGLSEGASDAAIIAAHRSLIKKVHPDHGGSDHLAQQVNEAKRVLQAQS